MSYQIDRHKFFDQHERKTILIHTEKESIVDQAKGRKTWQVRWTLVDLAFFSGLRVSEISNLKIKDLFLTNTNPYIRVRDGKGSKDRDIYIDNHLSNHITEYLKIKAIWDESIKPDAPFLTGRGGSHYSTTALTISFKKAVKATPGLRNDLSIHSARHTYATFLYRDTKDLRFVQKQLGHSDIGMTSLYADILPQENGRLANQMKRPI